MAYVIALLRTRKAIQHLTRRSKNFDLIMRVEWSSRRYALAQRKSIFHIERRGLLSKLPDSKGLTNVHRRVGLDGSAKIPGTYGNWELGRGARKTQKLPRSYRQRSATTVPSSDLSSHLGDVCDFFPRNSVQISGQILRDCQRRLFY